MTWIIEYCRVGNDTWQSCAIYHRWEEDARKKAWEALQEAINSDPSCHYRLTCRRS